MTTFAAKSNNCAMFMSDGMGSFFALNKSIADTALAAASIFVMLLILAALPVLVAGAVLVILVLSVLIIILPALLPAKGFRPEKRFGVFRASEV